MRIFREEEKLMSKALQFYKEILNLKFIAKLRSLTVVKANWKCSKTRMLTELRKALKFQSKFRQLDVRLMQEIRRSEIFHLRFIPSLLPTKHLREKMRA